MLIHRPSPKLTVIILSLMSLASSSTGNMAIGERLGGVLVLKLASSCTTGAGSFFRALIRRGRR